MWQPVLMINGFIISVLGALMILPAAVPWYYDGVIDWIFVQSGLFTVFIGGSLFLANYGRIANISILQGYLITVTCWFACPFFCALPFLGCDEIKTYTDALFEAASALTTTGSSVLSNVENLPASVLLWRAVLCGASGVGIVIFAVALMPFLGIGGMHIFNKENSDTEEKFLPKVRYIAKDIIIVYALLNILCALLLRWAGMEWFDAICHALATLCTGGLSTRNDSIAAFNSPMIETVIACFMLLGSLPMTYFVLAVKRKNTATIFGNTQINTFLKLAAIYITVLSIFYAYSANLPLTESFRKVSFNIISAMTTTGFSSSDFLRWGGWAPALFLVLYLHGGCTGSTTGSIKIFRWQVIAAFFRRNAVSSLSPNQVTVMKAGGRVIDENIVSSVFVMAFGFLFALMFFTLVLCFSGLDFLSALGAVAANITNTGIGLTESSGPAGNFAGFSNFCKYVLIFVMILGRLEILAVFILLRYFCSNRK